MERIRHQTRLVEIIGCPEYLAGHFRLHIGAPVKLLERMTCLDGVPATLWQIYLPASNSNVTDQDSPDKEIDDIFEQTSQNGTTIFVSADIADDEVAASLHIQPGNAILHVEHREKHMDGRLALLGFGRFRTDSLVLLGQPDDLTLAGGLRAPRVSACPTPSPRHRNETRSNREAE